MEGTPLAVVAAAAFAGSLVSGVLGMAGGMILLAVMLLFLEPLVAIPLHAVVQLVSNAARAGFQRQHVRRELVARYALFLLPMAFLGLAVARALPAEAVRLAIGVFVVVATWRPRWLLLGTHPEAAHPTRRFLWLGAATGFLGPTVGATGPLLAPFLLGLGLTRHAKVGTQAACQILGHLAKLAVFGAAGFAFLPYALPLGVLCGMVVAGTWVGSRLLEHVPERAFGRAYRLALTVIALRLVLEPVT